MKKTEKAETALDHLALVLGILSNPLPDVGNSAYVDALAFYNATCPETQIKVSPWYVTERVYCESPFDRTDRGGINA